MPPLQNRKPRIHLPVVGQHRVLEQCRPDEAAEIGGRFLDDGLGCRSRVFCRNSWALHGVSLRGSNGLSVYNSPPVSARAWCKAMPCVKTSIACSRLFCRTPERRARRSQREGLRVRLFIMQHARSQKVYSCLQFPDSWLNRYKTFFATPTCRARFVVTRVPCIICLSCCPIALIFRVTVVNLQRTQSLVTKKRILDLEQMYFYHVGPRTQSLVTKMGFGILNPKP